MAQLIFYDEAAAFLAAAEEALARDPVVTTVVATVTQRIAAHDRLGGPRRDHPRWWLVVREGDRVVGLAMRTAPFEPHPVYLLPMPGEAALELAQVLHERGEDVRAVKGALPAAEQVAQELARLAGTRARVHERLRLWEASHVVSPPSPPGRLRAARPEDAELATAWWRAFAADAAEQAGRPGETGGEQMDLEEMARRIAESLVWLWEDGGRVVHLTAHNAPAFGVGRIGPVYTPRGARGRGYAGAAVAALTQRLLDGGSRAVLFTDRDNPTSNRIYAAVGYRPVVDMAILQIAGSPSLDSS